MTDDRARAALPALVAGALLLGFSPILVRVSELGPVATAFHRTFLALPALWLWSAVARRAPSAPPPPRGRGAVARLVLAGVFFAGDLAFWHWSLRFTTVANATLFATSAPIWVTLGGFLVFRERVSRTFLVGLALALGGAAVLMGRSVEIGHDRLFGDALGVITGMFFGAYVLAVGRLRARHSTATIMAWTTAVTALVLLPVTLAFGEGLVARTLEGWAALVALALLAHVGGQGLIAFALAHLPVSFSSVGLLLEAVSAAVLAWVLLGEALGPWQALGAAVILAGIVIARRGSR